VCKDKSEKVGYTVSVKKPRLRNGFRRRGNVLFIWKGLVII